MAQIVFLTGVQDRIALAQRLVRKKVREGGRVCVLGMTPDLRRLSHALWSEPQLEFLPHVHTRVSPEPVVRELTPVWLVEQAVEGLDCDSVINCSPTVPAVSTLNDRVAEPFSWIRLENVSVMVLVVVPVSGLVESLPHAGTVASARQNTRGKIARFITK